VWLGCRFALRPEGLGNGLNDYGSNVAYVIPDSGFQFGQNRIQFALILGGNSPISELDVCGLRGWMHGMSDTTQ